MRVIAAYFPPPPARLLIGGAGGGREVLALACMGYEVLAFEPSGTLATALAKNLKKDLNVRVYRAGYEDMPRLFSVFPQEPSSTLEAEADFDAAILGWTSYSHLRTQARRIRTLSSFARHVRGPILHQLLALCSCRCVSRENRTFGTPQKRLPTGRGSLFCLHWIYARSIDQRIEGRSRRGGALDRASNRGY